MDASDVQDTILKYLILYLQDTFLEYLVLCKILFEDTFILHNEATSDPAFAME